MGNTFKKQRPQRVMPFDVDYNIIDKHDAPVPAKYKLVDKEIKDFYHKDGDAGYDMYCTKDMWVIPFMVRKVPVNMMCEIPKLHYGLVTSRSGQTLEGIVIVPGVIDSTYRGVINALVTRIGLLPRKIKKGTRISQLIIQPFTEMKWEKTDKLSETARGNSSFGKSGLN